MNQILGNKRPIYNQSEYSGEYNISSSLHFKDLHNRIQEKKQLKKNNEVIKEFKETLREDHINQTNQENNYESESENEKENKQKQHIISSKKPSFEPYTSYIKGGEDIIPGKSFTESQLIFRKNIVGRDIKASIKKSPLKNSKVKN